jgi:hypothetical protein
MVVVLAYVILILFKHPAEEIEQGPRAERLWRPLLAANLGLCISHAGVVGIFVTLEHYQRPVEQLKDRSTRECRSPSFVHARS